MTVLACVLIVALVASNAVWLRELRKTRSEAWTREQGLLNRIQHPQTFQPPDVPMPPDEELRTKVQDDWDLVGTIQQRQPD